MVETYLRSVLQHLSDHIVNRVEEFLPWNVTKILQPMKLAAARGRLACIVRTRTIQQPQLIDFVVHSGAGGP
jgi:hypothetical protein